VAGSRFLGSRDITAAYGQESPILRS
jgi:hypothetical protein